MSDLDSLLEWNLKPESQVRMEVSAGKLEGVEGGAAGVPSATEGVVRVVALLLSDMDDAYCGGVIGKDGRMCISTACSVASHRVNKCWDVVAKDSQSDTTLLYISCARVGGSGKSTAVFVEPTIPLEKLSATIRKLERPIGDWKILFRSIRNQPNITSEEADELVERSSKSSPRGLLTPRKAKKPRLVANLAAIKEDGVPQLDSISEELGLTPEDTCAALQVAWKPLISNQYTLQDYQTAHTEGLVEVAEDLCAELEAGELRTTRLEDDVGERTAESGTRSLFELATAAEEGIGGIDRLCASLGLAVGELRDEVQKAVGDTYDSVLLKIGEQLRISLAPLFDLFGALSSDKTTPGNKLDAKLQQLQAQMTELRTAVGSRQGMGFLEDHTHTMNLDARTEPEVDQLSEAMATMQGTLRNMQDQLASELVSVGTVNFISRAFTRSWLTSQGCNDKFVYFVDAVSLLALIQESNYSTVELVTFEGKLKNAGHASRPEAVVVHSFEVELPAMFGTESTSGVSRDGRVLPSCPTANEWDSGGGIRGAKFNLANNLKKADALRRRIADNLPQEATEVARQMMDDSVRFLQELSNWVSTHYHEVKTRSGTSDKECWGLVSHCVRTIFSVLGTARSPGLGPYPEGTKATSILWGTLQAHRVMRDMLLDGFAGYPKLSHVLNLHLQDNMVPRSKFEALEELVSKQDTKLRVLQTSVDKALTTKNIR
jgi:hypothetical protein